MKATKCGETKDFRTELILARAHHVDVSAVGRRAHKTLWWYNGHHTMTRKGGDITSGWFRLKTIVQSGSPQYYIISRAEALKDGLNHNHNDHDSGTFGADGVF